MSDSVSRLNAAVESRCSIERELGEGGTATVYLAEDRKHNHRVALKVLKAGAHHACAVRSDGEGYCWGRNDYGQVGDSSSSGPAWRSRVMDGHSLASVNAGEGGEHTCALTNAGEAYCWGRNNYGQLGDGTTNDRVVPLLVRFR